MNFQRLIQSSFLSKEKKEYNIKLSNGGTVKVKSGDILYVLLKEESNEMFKARFVDITDSGDIWAYLISNNDFVDIKIEQNRIEKIENPN